MTPMQLCVWDTGARPQLFDDLRQVAFVYNDGRVAELKLVDPARGRFLLSGWAQGDAHDRKRHSAIGGSFEVSRRRAQIDRLAVHHDAHYERVVQPDAGPVVTCVLGDLDSPIALMANVTCVDFRLPAGGPLVQFLTVAHEVGGGPGIFSIRGWPSPPSGEEEGGPLEYLGIHFAIRGGAASIRSTYAAGAR